MGALDVVTLRLVGQAPSWLVGGYLTDRHRAERERESRSRETEDGDDGKNEAWRLDLRNAPPGMPCVHLLVLAFAGVVMLLSLVFHSMKKTFQFCFG